MREFLRKTIISPSQTPVFTGSTLPKPIPIFQDTSGKKVYVFWIFVAVLALVCTAGAFLFYPVVKNTLTAQYQTSLISAEARQKEEIVLPEAGLFAMVGSTTPYIQALSQEGKKIGNIVVEGLIMRRDENTSGIALEVVPHDHISSVPGQNIILLARSETGGEDWFAGKSDEWVNNFALELNEKSDGYSGIALEIGASQVEGEGYDAYFVLLAKLKTELNRVGKTLFVVRSLNITSNTGLIEDESKNTDTMIGLISETDSGVPIAYSPEIRAALSEEGSAPYWLAFEMGQHLVDSNTFIHSVLPITYSPLQSVEYDGATGAGLVAGGYQYDEVSLHNQLRLYADLVQGAQKVGLHAFESSEIGVLDVLKSPGCTDCLSYIGSREAVHTEGDGKISTLDSERVVGYRNIAWDADGQVQSAQIDVVPAGMQVQNMGMALGKIALTFDDGPDPTWTPQILDILKQQGVHATFFVIGDEVHKYPQLVQRIVAEGHEIGNHSYSHPHDMTTLSPSQIAQEIEATNAQIASVTNIKTILFRTPNSVSDSLDLFASTSIMSQVGGHGMVLAGYDIDTHDWAHYDGDDMMAQIDAQNNGNTSQILLHDGGGDRSKTVAILPEIIEYLQKEHVQPVLLSQLIDRPVNTLAISGISVSQYQTLYRTWSFFGLLFEIFLAAAVTIGVFRYAFIALGIRRYFSAKVRRPLCYQNYDPLVSVLVPAFNESVVLMRTVQSLLRSTYRRLQIIIIDDQSTDDTYRIAQQCAKLSPKVLVRTQKNGGKSAALNYGLSFAKGDYVVSIDADTQFDPYAIARLVRHFQTDGVMGVAGTVHCGNHQESMLTRCQHLEYTFAQSIDKLSFDSFNAVSVVPGSIGAWRTDYLRSLGGYESDNHAEDTDLTIRTLASGMQVRYEPEAVAYTEAPQDMRSFFAQRLRWQYGTLQVLVKHRKMLFSPR